MSTQPDRDVARNLLLGLLAFQLNFIDRAALLGGFDAWNADRSRSLGRHLLDRGAIDAARHDLLEALVREHLKQHGDDPRASLAALSSVQPVMSELGDAAPEDVRESLAGVGKGRSDDESNGDDTETFVGSPTSSGGRFRIIRLHARGGLGEVFVAEDLELRRRVALKQIQDANSAHAEFRSRFVVEAEITGGLEHPGIVPVYGLGTYADGRPYYAMRFIEGDSLKEAIAAFHADRASEADPGRRSLELRKLLRRFLDVCNAIEYAHSRGVLHRDLKPGNIMLGPYGETLVVDWGLAKIVGRPDPAGSEATLHPASGSDVAPTQAGRALGTYEYMSPEQARGDLDALGARSDVYSLGATLYHLLTGRPAFERDADVVARVIAGDFPPPRRIAPGVPRALEAVCLKAMAREPAERYDSPRALADDVEHWLADEPVSARRDPILTRARRWMRKHRTLTSTAAATVVIGLVAALFAYRQERDHVRSLEKANGAAIAARNAARAQAELARRNEQEAVAARALEQEQTALARQRLYDARMAQVQQAWENYNGSLFWRLLDEQRPESQQGVDRRGFEWYYWHRRATAGQITLGRQPAPVRGLAFSADGRRIATVSTQWRGLLVDPRGSDQITRIWDLPGGGVAKTLERPASLACCIRTSPDGMRLCSVGRDGTVKVLDPSTPQELGSFDGFDGTITSLALGPDAHACAVGSLEGNVEVRDLATGGSLCRFKGPSSILSIAFSPDGRLLAIGGGVTVQVRDVATGQETAPSLDHEGVVESLEFSPDGRRLASASQDRTVIIREVGHWSNLLTLRHRDIVRCVSFSPDGRRLATGTPESLVRVWDLATGREELVLKGHAWSIEALAFGPDGRHLASGDLGGTTRVWDLSQEQEAPSLAVETPWVGGYAFSPDGERVAFVAEQSRACVREPRSGRAIADLETGSGNLLMNLAFSPDGARLATQGRHEIAVWDLASGSRAFGREPRRVTGRACPIAFAPDGKSLALATEDGPVSLLDAETGRELRAFTGHDAELLSVAFRPDGRRLAGADVHGTVTIWNPATGATDRKLTLPAPAVSVAYSPDGRRLAMASIDRAWLWDPSNDREPMALVGHTGLIGTVAFSPDGRRLATAGGDRVVKIWDVVTGQEVLSLTGHKDSIQLTGFSADGRRLLSAGQDRTVRIWEATPK